MRKSRRILYILFWATMLGFYASSQADESLTLIENPPFAPAFSLPNMDGELFSLEHYKGKIVIINFWATWCPPCREELPSMNRAWHKLKQQNDNIAMIAINVGEDEDTIFSFMANYPIEFQVLLDKTGEIIKQWPIKGLPTTFVVDSKGRLYYRAIGGREWDDNKLLDLIKSIKTDGQ